MFCFFFFSEEAKKKRNEKKVPKDSKDGSGWNHDGRVKIPPVLWHYSGGGFRALAIPQSMPVQHKAWSPNKRGMIYLSSPGLSILIYLFFKNGFNIWGWIHFPVDASEIRCFISQGWFFIPRFTTSKVEPHFPGFLLTINGSDVTGIGNLFATWKLPPLKPYDIKTIYSPICWKKQPMQSFLHAVDGSETVNNGINYQPQLVNGGFLKHQQNHWWFLFQRLELVGYFQPTELR